MLFFLFTQHYFHLVLIRFRTIRTWSTLCFTRKRCSKRMLRTLPSRSVNYSGLLVKFHKSQQRWTDSTFVIRFWSYLARRKAYKNARIVPLMSPGFSVMIFRHFYVKAVFFRDFGLVRLCVSTDQHDFNCSILKKYQQKKITNNQQ